MTKEHARQFVIQTLATFIGVVMAIGLGIIAVAFILF